MLAASLSSCFSNPAPEVYSPGSREEMTKWKDEEHKYLTFYSPIDSFSIFQGAPPHAQVYHKEGSSLEVSWSINNIPYPNFPVIKEWVEEYKMWDTWHVSVGPGAIKIGDKLKVVAKINGKSFINEAEAKRNIILTDIFGVTWGMTKEMVKERETQRKKMLASSRLEIHDTYPNELIWDGSSTFNEFLAFTKYTFTNNMLTRVAEYVPIPSYDPARLIRTIDLRARKLGLQEVVVVDQNWNLLKEYKWSKGNLNFEVTFIDSPAGRCLGIVYTKG